MVERVRGGFLAIGYYAIKLTWKSQAPSETQIILWIEENCEGKYYIGSYHKYRRRTDMSLFFQTSADAMAIKLAWS